MIVLLNTLEAWLLGLGIILGVAVILFVIFYFVSGFRKKEAKPGERVVVDEEFITTMLHGLGELNNINSVSVDNGRVNFSVKDLELLVADELKALSSSGVFITGNNVKLLFKYDSNTIVSALEERGVNRC